MRCLGEKCAKNTFAAGGGGAYSAPSDPLAGFKGPTSKGRGGQGRRSEGRGWEGKGRGREGKGGRERKGS